MRKLIVISFLTLDGVMQAPGGENEDPSGGFKYGGWQIPFFGGDDNPVADAMTKAGALFIGRKTYDIFAGYWPTEGKDIPMFGDFMNNITKYVASKTLKKTEWQNSVLLEGDLSKAVQKIKSEAGKDIYMFGSGDLCQTLMQHKLIDEYLLMIHPLALGHGKRLFRPESPKQDLELTSSKTTKEGVLILNYRTK
jgi:dihydrofolate reductase